MSNAMLTLIENGEVYAPRPLGRQSVLLVDGRIGVVGQVDAAGAGALGLEIEVIDAAGCVVTPGLIDPHEHILGGSGEEGFATQSPEITLSEIVTCGITTVVGCLGLDTTMKTLPGLLAKVKGLREEGLSAYMWSGGYNVPPTTLTDSIRNDILFVEEVIGCGEVAISDERSTDPMPHELARLVNTTYAGGKLSRKAGVTHFHVGESERRLGCLRELLEDDRFQVKPEMLYATHVERSEALMCDAIVLARQGGAIDIDVVEKDLAKWLRFYREHRGPPDRLTFSSDASLSSPGTLFDQVRGCVVEHGFALEEVLPHVTSNTASILRLDHKGSLEPGKDGDVLVLRRDTLEPVDVIACGRRMVAGGRFQVSERFLEDSNRRVELHGQKV